MEISTTAMVAKIDAEQGNLHQPKKFEGVCKVCGRQFTQLLRQGVLVIGCPTNDNNHWAANNEVEEPKPVAKKKVLKKKKSLTPKK